MAKNDEVWARNGNKVTGSVDRAHEELVDELVDSRLKRERTMPTFANLDEKMAWLRRGLQGAQS